MKIDKIEIYGYGKWLQKEFTDLQMMQIFVGDNEAGKSTLSSFIQTMFFGFPSARKKDSNAYVPKLGEAYGGRLFLSGTRFGEVIVERLKERNRGKATITHADGQQEVVDHMGAYLLGVDRDTYELLYTFKIDRLLELNKVKKEDLNRYLLGVGTSGSEKILELADVYRKEAQKEFRPTGTVPPLNQKLKETETLWLKLQKAKKKNNEYESLLLQADALRERIDKGYSTQTELENENEQLREAIRLNDSYQEWVRLNQSIDKIDMITLPKDAQNQWEKLQAKIGEDLQQQASLQQQLKSEQKQFAEFEHAKWFKQTKQEWQVAQSMFSQVSAGYSKLQFLQQQFVQQEAEMFLYKRKYGLSVEAELPLLTEEQQQELIELIEQEEQLHNSLKETAQIILENEKKLDNLEIRIQEEQQQLVPEATFQAWKKEVEKPKEKPNQKKSQPIGFTLCLILTIVFIVLAAIVPSVRIYTAIAAVASLSAALLLRKKPAEVPEHALQMEDYIQQATRRARITEWTEEAEKEQELLIDYLNKQEAMEMKIASKREEHQEWLIQIGYPDFFSLQRILNENPAVELHQLLQKINETKREIEHLEGILGKWQNKTKFIRTHFQMEHLDEKAFLDSFTEQYNAVLLEESMADHATEKIVELQEALSDVQNRLTTNHQKRQEMLYLAKVDSEAEFYQLIREKENQLEQKRKRDLLSEQLAGKEDLLQQHADKQKAEKNLQRNVARLQQLSSDLKKWQKEEMEYQHEISLLEEGGTYSTLLQEYANVETQLREMIVQWGKKVVAAEWLEETLRYGKENRMPDILEDMTHYFERLTDGAYRRIIFQKSGLKIQHKSGTIYQPFELSQGTVEQLYIAMRFSFIKNTADIANLPILVDDGFVNFDSNRKQITYQLLKELSKTVQVFFFTFDRSVEETFSPQQIMDLA